MFFITANGQFWNGKCFVNEYQDAIVYYSLAACMPTLNALKNKNAHATYLTDKQLKEHSLNSHR